jgi:EmrB/QacA subfamily drug resistance transporter
MLDAAAPQPLAAPCPPAPSAPRASLWAAVAGSTMAFVDGSVVNVALPVMQRELHASVASMQWVVEAYALFLAALVLVGGALGDRLGRRRVFVAGVVLFTAASLACAAAPNVAWLVALRAFQGGGAALLVPGSLSLIGAAYRGEARGAAIGTWSAATAIAAAVAPVFGGWLVGHASWRWIFVANVPVGTAVAVFAMRHVGETRDASAAAQGPVDVAGAAVATAGLGVLTWALLEAPSHGGLGAPGPLVALGAGVASIVAFAFVESKVRAPMVPLELFRSRVFVAANVATLFLYAALGGCLFFLPFDLITVQGYSPAAAGGALLPLVVLVALLSRASGSFAARYGARWPLVVGPLVAAVGFAALALPAQGGPYWRTFLPGVAVLGVGMGITVAPLTTAVLAAVEERHAGAASGINNAVARAAGLLAVAGLGIVLVTTFDHALGPALDALGPSRLPPEARAALERGRAQLTATPLPPGLDDATRDAVRLALAGAFVSGFRVLVRVCAALALLSCVS